MPTSETAKQFSYTAKRSSYGIIVGAFIFILLVESGVIDLLITLLVHLLWLRIILLLFAVGAHLYVCLMLLLPFWTKHSLTEKHVHLHYGSALNIRIPFTSISSLQAMNEKIQLMQSIGAQYIVAKQRLTICFSDHNILLLTLHSPLIIEVGFSKRKVTSIMLNIDRRDEFLIAFKEAKASLVNISSDSDEIRPEHT